MNPSDEHTCQGGTNPPFPGPCKACEREKLEDHNKRDKAIAEVLKKVSEDEDRD